MTLDERLQKLEEELAGKKKELADFLETFYRAYERKKDGLYKLYDAVRCPRCEGFGRLERMDSGYMKKFGLREWDGCKYCGSTKPEESGRGYILKTEKKET